MSVIILNEPLRVISGPGTAVANTTTTTTLLPSGGKVMFKAGWYRFVGQQFRIRATGTVTRTSGTLSFQFRQNGVSVITFTAMTNQSKTDVPWTFRAEGTVRVVSNISSVMWIGDFTSELVVGSPAPSSGGTGRLLMPASAPAVGGTFDRSIDQEFDVLVTWSAASAQNSIQLQQLTMECTQ